GSLTCAVFQKRLNNVMRNRSNRGVSPTQGKKEPALRGLKKTGKPFRGADRLACVVDARRTTRRHCGNVVILTPCDNS
ncbi:hypothetical protein, partial [Paraburkholderia tropica]|uniref:hypothetical protein n=1 Tax=Paraburkholderia tropica TaxID=92647 RepID=UPI002AAF3765